MPSTCSTEDEAALKQLCASELLRDLERVLSFRGAPQNIFRVLPHLVRSEALHSDLLAWLIDPSETHQLGDAFAARFLGRALGTSESRLHIDRVHREFPTGQGPVDLLIEATVNEVPFVIAIENKIDASETNNQLVRYCEALQVHTRFRTREIRLIFLTIEARQPDLAPIQPPPACVGYASVCEALRETIGSSRAHSNRTVGSAFAEHYLEMLETEIMREATIVRLVSELVRNYPQGWRVLRGRLPSERDDLLVAFATAVCQTFSRELHGEWRFSLQKDRYSRVWPSEWENGFGTGQDSVVAGVEAAHWTFARTHIRLSVDPPAAEASKDHFKYEMRLKLGDARPSPLWPAVLDALKRLEAIRPQIESHPNSSTVTIATNRHLPAMNEAGAAVVVDWVKKTPIAAVIRTVSAILQSSAQRR